MDLDKRYKTVEGIECNILQLVKMEPEWAANRIQIGEKAIKASTEIIKDFVKAVEAKAEEKMLMTGKLEGAHYAAMKELSEEL